MQAFSSFFGRYTGDKVSWRVRKGREEGRWTPKKIGWGWSRVGVGGGRTGGAAAEGEGGRDGGALAGADGEGGDAEAALALPAGRTRFNRSHR